MKFEIEVNDCVLCLHREVNMNISICNKKKEETGKDYTWFCPVSGLPDWCPLKEVQK